MSQTSIELEPCSRCEDGLGVHPDAEQYEQHGGGSGLIADPSACGYPGHCEPGMTCPECGGRGMVRAAEVREPPSDV